ncbi:GNAT family N-acetyltransferase [Microlunatus soli]|uniref:Predicted acetyltransferase n=1 Tax=Microlunatus soli TaxID=630515 RepID=A0A1H1MHG8_9ACTN|nr:GNAT family N-acetyltransferase [Microlunatus soli]SDR86223.1 Predicted acetyltransferase [Microlunatus soli]
MIKLVEPSLDHYDSWADAVREFHGGHIDGSGLSDGATPDRATCEVLIEKQRQHADVDRRLPAGLVHSDYYWITDDEAADEVVGFIALRHELNDFLSEVGGHVGYAVRPSRRREGFASGALKLVLDRARELGLDRILVTCDDDNEASARTIESAGGHLQDTQDRPERGYGLVRRYWITL